MTVQYYYFECDWERPSQFPDLTIMEIFKYICWIPEKKNPKIIKNLMWQPLKAMILNRGGV